MATTGQFYVDNVMSLADVDYTALELDRPTVLMLVNQARQTIFNETSGLFGWRYGAMKSNAANPFTFADSDRMSRIVRVSAHGSTSVPSREIARAELASVSANSFNSPTTSDSIYYLSGLTVTALPNTITNIDIDYLRAPTDLAMSDTDDTIPYDFQQLVIRKALLSAYEKMNDVNSFEAVKNDFEIQLDQMKSSYAQVEDATRVALQSKMNYQSEK